MNKKMSAILFALIIILCSACEGPQGPQGPQGIQGESGPNAKIYDFTVTFSKGTYYAFVTTLIKEAEDVILLYLIVSDPVTEYQPLPCLVPNGNGLFMQYSYMNYGICTIEARDANTGNPMWFATDSDVPFRAVIIKGTVAAKMQIDYSNYTAVAKKLNIE
jgi:hypothetical protein